MELPQLRLTAALLVAACRLSTAGAQPAGEASGWEHVGGDQGGSRYSPLAQINRENVWRLERAWTWRHGDFGKFPERRPFSGFHATPILLPDAAGGSLVLCTPIQPAGRTRPCHRQGTLELRSADPGNARRPSA